MALEYTADASMTVTRTAMIISVYRSVFDARFLSTLRTILYYPCDDDEDDDDDDETC